MKARDLIRNGALVQLRCGAICVAISPVFNLDGILVPVNGEQRFYLLKFVSDNFMTGNWLTLPYDHYNRNMEFVYIEAVKTRDGIESGYFHVTELDIVKIKPVTNIGDAFGLLLFQADEVVKRFNENWSYCYNVVDGNAELIL